MQQIKISISQTYSRVRPLGMGLPPSFKYRGGIARKFPSSSLAQNFFSYVHDFILIALHSRKQMNMKLHLKRVGKKLKGYIMVPYVLTCFSSCLNSCLTLSMRDLSFSVGTRGPNPMLSEPSKAPSKRLASLFIWSSSSSDMVAPVPSPGETPVK